MKKYIKILLIILIATIISAFLVLKIYADYANVLGQSSDTAYIAKWNVTMNSMSDIFYNIYEIGILGKTENDKYIIAPGVYGNFEIELTNNGDVIANVTKLQLSKANDSVDIPLQFSIDERKTWTDINNGISIKDNNIINIGESRNVLKVYWRWPAEGNNIADTVAGIAAHNGNKNFTLKVEVTAEQLMK